MRTLALLFSLTLSILSYSLSKAEDELFSPIPSPTAEPTVVPQDDSSRVATVFPEDQTRTLAEVWVVSGEEVLCAKDDKTVSSDTFRLTDKTYSMTPATSALYCTSRAGANLGVSTSGDLNRSYSTVVANIGASSVRIMPDNSNRSRAVFQVASGAAYCGYTCPASPSSGFLLTPSNVFEFKGVHSICCISVSGLTTIAAASEVGGVK